MDGDVLVGIFVEKTSENAGMWRIKMLRCNFSKCLRQIYWGKGYENL